MQVMEKLSCSLTATASLTQTSVFIFKGNFAPSSRQTFFYSFVLVGVFVLHIEKKVEMHEKN